MNKSTLDTFIKKYNLNGNVESVKIIINDTEKTLKTSAVSEDRNVVINVSIKDFTELETAEIGIYNTAKLKQMLSVLSEDITVKPNIKNDKITSLSFSDTDTQVQYATADSDIIASPKTLKRLPDFNVEIDFNENFINKFIKSKNALSDIDNFTLTMNKKKKLEMVIGENSKSNTNKIILDVPTKNGKDTVSKPISFSAKYLKEILTSNNDCDNAVLKVSDEGMASITFEKDNFESVYYLLEIKNVD